MSEKPRSGGPMPRIALPAVHGGEVTLGSGDGWRLVVVYRGRHCPICKKYLGRLRALAPQFRERGAAVIAVSADPREKAEADVKEFGWDFTVGYGLTPDQMRALGLYISEPRSPQETDRPFAEPAVFLVRPDNRVQIVDIGNAPFTRADLEQILGGLKWIQDNDYPVRGTLE